MGWFSWETDEVGKDYSQDLDSRVKQADDDLKEIHQSLDSEEDAFNSCGDSNAKERD